MIAAGIDLGGTKIEAQVFGSDWQVQDRRRVETPRTYPALVSTLAEIIAWIDAKAPHLPIGVSAAGLINGATGLALTANLPATGKPFPADLQRVTQRRIRFVNDCRALTLSEAVFGAARGQSPAIGLILGTGLGGGVAIEGRLVEGPSGTGGEFGHFPLSAVPVVRYGLPLLPCGCGRAGCTETLLAGPGLTRLHHHFTGQTLDPPHIAAGRKSDPLIAKSWGVWLELLTDLLITLTMTIDPACIVLGGGLSQIAGLLDDLRPQLSAAQLASFSVPDLKLADGGDASGARGAAWAAFKEARDA
jgi:predicted NBD/HSP70 family sugar kinase